MGFSKQLTQDEELSLKEYLNLYANSKLPLIDQSFTLLVEHENFLYIYCNGNNTIVVLDLELAKFDKGYYGNAYKIIRIKPPPNFTVNHMQISSSHINVSMLLWGSYGVYVINKLPKILPNSPHLLYVKGVILENSLLNKETIIKCKFNLTVAIGHTFLYIGVLTSLGNFRIYQLNNKEKSSSLNKTHSLFTTNLCSGEPFPSFNSNQSYNVKYLNIQGALCENYVDFVFSPLYKSELEIYFLQGTGSILVYNLTLALNMAQENDEIIAKISSHYSYYTHLMPELEELYDSDVKYTSLYYIASTSPDILVVVQHVTNTHEPELKEDTLDSNIILRHYAILNYTCISPDQGGDIDGNRTRLYLLESLGIKVGRNRLNTEIISPLLNAELPGYLISFSRQNALPLSILITMPWTIDTRKLLDIFLANRDSPTDEKTANDEEICDLIAYNVNMNSIVSMCSYDDSNDNNKGCLLMGACCASLKTNNDVIVMQLLSQQPPEQGCQLMFISLDKVSCEENGQIVENASLGEADAFISRLIAMIADTKVSSLPNRNSLQNLLIDVMYGTDTGLYESVKAALSSSSARLKSMAERFKNGNDTFTATKDQLDTISNSVVTPAVQTVHELGLKIEAILSEMATQGEVKATLSQKLSDLHNFNEENKCRLEGLRRTLKTYFGRALKLVEGYDEDSAKHLTAFGDLLKKCQTLTCSLTALQEYYVKLEMAHNEANLTRQDTTQNSPSDFKGKKLDLFLGMINDHDNAIGKLVNGVKNLNTRLS